MHTTRGISAAMASSIPAAASGGLCGSGVVSAASPGFSRSVAYGTKMAVAVAPVSFTASLTLAKTGRPRCVWPAFLGFVPPTTLVPGEIADQIQCSPECTRPFPAVAVRGEEVYHSRSPVVRGIYRSVRRQSLDPNMSSSQKRSFQVPACLANREGAISRARGSEAVEGGAQLTFPACP